MRGRFALVALLTIGGFAAADPPASATWPARVTTFLADWAMPVGAEKDAATGFPRRIKRAKDSMVMVLVPAGTFQMGATPGDPQARSDESPRHAVTLTSSYYMDETPVTNEQFKRFTTSTRFKTGAEADGTGWIADESGGNWKETKGASWRAPLPGGKRQSDWEKHPVVLVSWDDADAYAKWIGYSVGLPTEAQYERALRGGVEGTRYPWGDDLPPPSKYGNYADDTAKRKFPKWTWTIEGFDDGYERTSPVKSFKANPYGLYDVSGNVWGWCADGYDTYPSGAVTDPTGSMSGAADRVIRGGSWTGGAEAVRPAYRYKYAHALRCGYVGFRLVRPVTTGRTEDAAAVPDVAELLRRVDATLFFPDAQSGLISYECDVSSTTSSTMDATGKMQPDPKSAKPVAHVAVDAKAGTKTWTDGAGKKLVPGTFTPFCGPWTLTNVMRVEVELFRSPLSKRFTTELYDFGPMADANGEGGNYTFLLRFTPKVALGEGDPAPLNPIVTRIDLSVTLTTTGEVSVTGGALALDQKIAQGDAAFECEFEPHGTLRRISKIKTHLSSFNLAIEPTLTFSYGPQGSLALPKSVVFQVPGGQLSGELGRMPGGGGMSSALFYDNFVVKSEPVKR